MRQKTSICFCIRNTMYCSQIISFMSFEGCNDNVAYECRLYCVFMTNQKLTQNFLEFYSLSIYIFLKKNNNLVLGVLWNIIFLVSIYKNVFLPRELHCFICQSLKLDFSFLKRMLFIMNAVTGIIIYAVFDFSLCLRVYFVCYGFWLNNQILADVSLFRVSV